MMKRVLSAAMWLFLIAWAWNYAAWMFGVPEGLGPLVGAAVALFVAIDPIHLFFARQEPVVSRPTATFTRELRGIE